MFLFGIETPYLKGGNDRIQTLSTFGKYRRECLN